MPITAHQIRQRKSRLGSSDVAALFGLNRFQSEYDVRLDKTGPLGEDPKTTEWLEPGNEFEPIILARAQQELGALKKNPYRSAKPRGLPLGSHIDAIVVETGRPVEAKTCGIWWPAPEDWGQPGTDQVPDRVLIQAHLHMICTDTGTVVIRWKQAVARSHPARRELPGARTGCERRSSRHRSRPLSRSWPGHRQSRRHQRRRVCWRRWRSSRVMGNET